MSTAKASADSKEGEKRSKSTKTAKDAENSKSISSDSTEEQDEGSGESSLELGPEDIESLVDFLKENDDSRARTLESALGGEVLQTGGTLSTESNYSETSTQRSRDREQREKRDEKGMYHSGDDENPSMYESGTDRVHLASPGEAGLYDGHIKLDPSERAWNDDSHWQADTGVDMRGVGGAEVMQQRDMIEGQTFRGQGERDGFSTMSPGNTKPDYESGR